MQLERHQEGYSVKLTAGENLKIIINETEIYNLTIKSSMDATIDFQVVEGRIEEA